MVENNQVQQPVFAPPGGGVERLPDMEAAVRVKTMKYLLRQLFSRRHRITPRDVETALDRMVHLLQAREPTQSGGPSHREIPEPQNRSPKGQDVRR